MTGSRLNRIHWLVLAALCLCWSTVEAIAQPDPIIPSSPHSVQVQSPTSGSLAGRITDLHSAPLANTSVLLRNQATGAQLRAITVRNGGFRFPSLPVGEYTLEVDEPRLGHGRLEGIVVTGGVESRLQAAIELAPPPLPTPAPPERPLALAAPPPNLQPEAPAKRSIVSDFTPPVPQPESAPDSQLMAAAIHPQSWHVPSRPMRVPDTQSDSALVAEVTAPAPPAASPTVRGPEIADSTVSTRHTRPETTSAIVEPLLTLAAPHSLSLSPRIDTRLLAASAATGAVRAAALKNPAHLGPIVKASQAPDPVAPAVETNLTAAQLETLPVSGRRWQQFLLDTPGAAASTDSVQPSFRASSIESAGITIDGVSARSAFGLAPNLNPPSDPSGNEAGRLNSVSRSWPAGRGLGISEAAIREVTATAGNAEAKSMRSAGGSAEVHTQHGTDALHGQGFLFDRQNSWGARNPFTQWVQNLGSAGMPEFTPVAFTPPDRELVFGLGAGNRIRRDKLFWFGALDGYRRNDPGVASAKNAGEFFNLPEPTSSAITLLSAQLGESQNQAYGDFLGLPSSGYQPAGLEELAALLGPAPRTAAQWLGFGRIDWQMTERQRLTLEGTNASWNSPGGGFSRVSEGYGNRSFGSSQSSQDSLIARWEAYLTPNLLAVTQASAGHEILSAHPETPSAFERAFLNGNFWGQLPQIVVDSRYGFTIGNPSRFGQGSYPDEKLLHAQEFLSWVHGKILIRSGFALDHNADRTSLLRNQTGTYVYSKVQNFISDALSFEKFGIADALDAQNPHNCDVTGKPWYASDGTLMGLGAMPCYSHYSQTMGPSEWHLSTNDWAGYTSAQWQARDFAVVSAGLRWELEQMPPPIAWLANPDLPSAGKMPSPAGNWGPRVSLALGKARTRWPVLRIGYGLYFARADNAMLETALTETGSLKGDLNFFMRPQDDCQHCAGGAPPFPYVFAGEPSSVVKPGVVEFAAGFHVPEVHQAVAAIEQTLPGRVQITVAGLFSLGRRLPVFIDTNIDPAVNPGTITAANSGITYAVEDASGRGPIKAARITVPLFGSWPSADCPAGSQLNLAGECGRLNPNYQQVTQITSRANSTYEAAMLKIVREDRRGLSLRAHYTYAHAMDWNPGQFPLNPVTDFREEYGTSNLDVRHTAALMATFEPPWRFHSSAGRIANDWMLSGIGLFRSGLPYTMRVSGSIPTEIYPNETIVGLAPGMNGSGGDNRVYGLGSNGIYYDIGRNTFRYPNTWKADLRLARRFNLGEMRQLELLAESFNLFNHQNVTELETTGYSIENGSPGELPTLNFLTGLKPNTEAFGQPLNINATDFYRERQIQLGMRLRF